MQNAESQSRRILTLIFCLFAFWLVAHYWDAAVSFFGVVIGALSPLIIGFAIAYVLNIIMVPAEAKLALLLKGPVAKKCLRPLSILIAWLAFIALIAALTGLVIPRLWEAIEVLATQISNITVVLMPYIGEWLSPDFLNQLDMQSLVKNALKWLLSFAGGTLDGLVSGASAFFSRAAAILIAVVLSVYLLSGKEKLMSELSLLMNAYLPKRFNCKLRSVANVTNSCFHRYIVGQTVDAFILGSLCAIGMGILQMPYAVMIGCVVGATAVIPFVGAYIGAFVGAVLILTVSPIKALIFLIFLVILQQLESNLIYPRVVGSSIGLPGMWVLIAVAVGGSLAGIAGIILSVPLMATAYHLLRDGTAERRAAVAEEESDLTVSGDAAGLPGGDGSAKPAAASDAQSGGQLGNQPESQNADSSQDGSSDDESEANEAGQNNPIVEGMFKMADALGSALGISGGKNQK